VEERQQQTGLTAQGRALFPIKYDHGSFDLMVLYRLCSGTCKYLVVPRRPTSRRTTLVARGAAEGAGHPSYAEHQTRRPGALFCACAYALRWKHMPKSSQRSAAEGTSAPGAGHDTPTPHHHHHHDSIPPNL
jgi:hypothetical protein